MMSTENGTVKEQNDVDSLKNQNVIENRKTLVNLKFDPVY